VPATEMGKWNSGASSKRAWRQVTSGVKVKFSSFSIFTFKASSFLAPSNPQQRKALKIRNFFFLWAPGS
jgi:hypothetical protein